MSGRASLPDPGPHGGQPRAAEQAARVAPPPVPGQLRTSDSVGEFERAAIDVQRLAQRPGNDTLLKLYALYKQGTHGDACGSKPGFFDFVGTAKYEAWAQLRGMSGEEARLKYVELVRKLERGG